MIKAPTLRERWNDLVIRTFTDTERVVLFGGYINFTAQTLNLGQFIPTNSKGEPMEKPKLPGDSIMEEISREKYPERLREYQEAVDKVMFEGWEWKESPDCGKTLYDGEYWYADGALDNMTIEEFMDSGIELHLKDKPAKELGL